MFASSFPSDNQPSVTYNADNCSLNVITLMLLHTPKSEAGIFPFTGSAYIYMSRIVWSELLGSVDISCGAVYFLLSTVE